MHYLRIPCYCDQEEFDTGHSRLGTTAGPENGSPAKGMPEPLPDIHIERSSPLLGASKSLQGEVSVTGLSLLPARQDSRGCFYWIL